MTVFKCFFPSGSAIAPWSLGGAGKRTGKPGEHCLLFWKNKKGQSKMCSVVQIELCVFRRADPVLRLASSNGKCFYYTILDILLLFVLFFYEYKSKEEKLFQESLGIWQQWLIQLSWKVVFKYCFLHDVAIQLTFSLKVNWVFGQEEKVWSSCQALQVWKIIGFGQKITGHCFWEQSKLILRTAAGSKMFTVKISIVI